MTRPRKTDPPTVTRNCLGGCGSDFQSRGPGNRVCPKCSARNNGLSAREIVPHRSHVEHPDQVERFDKSG